MTTAEPHSTGTTLTDSGPQPVRPHQHHQTFWLWVMCLTGVDYFSTLGYQPSIAFEATGLLTPFATVILVLVTLLGALPVYAHVAKQSPHGQGSIGMLEHLLSGWSGKALVLLLLGFAATDFVITKTLSAADAAAHLVGNPLIVGVSGELLTSWWWTLLILAAVVGGLLGLTRVAPGWLKAPLFVLAAIVPVCVLMTLLASTGLMLVTMALLVLLGGMFLRGFKEVIGLAVVIVGVYLLLNVIVIGSSLVYLCGHEGLLADWFNTISRPGADLHFPEGSIVREGSWSGTWIAIVGVCLLYFPKLALGLSGFETGVAVMPLIKGNASDTEAKPQGRIRNARYLLLTAALIMSVLLLGSSLVTSTLIPAGALLKQKVIDPQTKKEKEIKGKAVDRSLAYLSHSDKMVNGRPASDMNPMFGEAFGTIYDISTIVILWFAGASAMAGLLNLVPQYLPRYGMAPEWARAIKPLVILFTAVNLFVTWEFDASVEKQGAAYATGVLVLMTSACVATVIDFWRTRAGPWYRRLHWYFGFVLVVFVYTTLANIVEKPVGLFIAFWFILAIFVSSLVSRLRRSTELRFGGFRYLDGSSKLLWDSLKMLEFPVLVPHRPGHRGLKAKEDEIRKQHRLDPDVPIVFLEVEVGDASDFYQMPLIEVTQEEGRFILRVTHCASIPHVIAAIGLELSRVGSPPEIHFGWSAESPIAANLSFLFLGEGNVPWMVRELILAAEADPAKQPRIVIG